MSNQALADVCQPERAVALDPLSCCDRLERGSAGPIDTYIDHQRHVLLLGDPDALEASPTLARLLLLGLVTGVESYFRGVLAQTLRICPFARTHAGEQLIAYGSVRYYDSREIELALFEGYSFTSTKEIRSRTQKVLDVAVPAAGSLHDALERYQLVCELRHAAVHAHGSLTSGNARALGLPPTMMPGVVQLDLPALHSLGAVCLSVVRAYNRFLYGAIIARWVNRRFITGDWSADWRPFRELHAAFYSVEDSTGEPDPRRAYGPVRSQVVSRGVSN